jgi:hypothetical protein
VAGFDTPVRTGEVNVPGARVGARVSAGRPPVASTSIGEPHDGQKREASATADAQLGQEDIGGL